MRHERNRPDRPGSGNQVLFATIVLLILLIMAIGGAGIWTGEPFPVSP